MEMAAGGETGGADVTQELALDDMPARRDFESAQVGIESLRAVGMRDNNILAVA